MKLQLALDTLSLSESLSLVRDIEPYIDVVEIGTPFLLENGMEAVRIMKEAFPSLEILADTKIMDAGELETRLACEAGSDYVTVLGVTDYLTIEACHATVQRYGATVVVDMICVPDLKTRIQQLETFSGIALAVHTGVDQQKAGRTPLDDLVLMRKHSHHAKIFVAGGINSSTVEKYLPYAPDVLIVGGGICSAADPVAEAKAIHTIIKRSIERNRCRNERTQG